MRDYTEQELQHRFQGVYDEVCRVLNICVEKYYPSGYNEYLHRKQTLEEINNILGGDLIRLRPTPSLHKK